VALIGVGLDAVEIGRFRDVLARTPALEQRLFTEGERAYGRAGNDPAPRLAARFAAKEAAMKALGVGLGAFAFHDVEVVNEESGAPGLRVTGRAAELALGKGVAAWRVSLTHTDSVAMAVVIVA
jgi:holo-[acyl-carrier protein] synthase